ncbi:MAG: hypothetical protein AAGH88_03290 [Planctomycetota bacterium]
MSTADHETSTQNTPIEALESALRHALTTYLETDSSDQEQIASLKQQIQATQQTLDLPSMQTALDALIAADAEQFEQKKAKAVNAWQAVAESLSIQITAPPRRKHKTAIKRLSSVERQRLLARLAEVLAEDAIGLTASQIASTLRISVKQTKRLLQDPETQAVLKRQGHARHSRYVLKQCPIP